MTLSLPSANVSVRKAGLGVATSGPTNVAVFIGPSSKGPMLTPQAFNTPEGASGVYGAGPMPKAAAYGTRTRSARHIVVRVPAFDRAPFVSAVTKPSGKDADVTAAPIWGYDVVIEFVVGGTVGTAGITYKVSLNGGVTWGATTPLGTNTSIDVDGASVDLTSGQAWAAGNQIAYYTVAGSQAIKTPKIVRVGSSTCAVTITGTPEDEYDIVLDVVKGGTIGTTGIVLRYSLDGGETFSPNTALNTANTLTIADGDEPSGLAFAFAAGTLDAGDKVTSATTGPACQASDVQAALDNLRSSTHEWRFVSVATDGTPATASGIGSKVSSFAGNNVFTYALLSARDRNDGEVDALGAPSVFWAERIIADYANFASDRVAISAGRSRITCPITGRANRRPTSWIVAAKLVENTPQVDPGRVADGPLSEDVRIYDANGNLAELDSRVMDSLHVARFLTLRTYERLTGTFVTRGNVKCSEASEFNRIALRAVMDIASETYQAVLLQQIENNLRANPLTGAQPGEQGGATVFPGAIAEADAVILDRELMSALNAVLVSPGYVSGVRARVSRTDPFLTTGKLTAKVSIAQLGYVDTFDGEIFFENPKFAALTA